MTRFVIVFLMLIVTGSPIVAQTPADTARPAADTLFVIPAGPVAGSFTSAARIEVLDTIAGWAKIRVDGWVPVRAVIGRMSAPPAAPSASSKLHSKASASTTSDGPSNPCEALTKKGNRCKRAAAPGSRFCWQHQK